MEVYLASLALFVLGPLLRALVWRVPPSLLGFPLLFRAALGASVVTLLAGLLIQLGMGVSGSDPTLAARVGAGVGAAIALIFTFAASQRSRTLRATLHLCRFLSNPARREPVFVALCRVLDGAQPTASEPPDAYAELLLMATGPMTIAGYWEPTFERLLALDVASLTPRTVALRAQALATCALQLGRLEAAQDALDTVTSEVEHVGTRRWLEVTRALLLVILGNVEEALERLDAEAASEDAALAASHRVVRAHAAACSGRDEEARLELERLRVEAGPLSLERALMPVGPATEIARAVLVGDAPQSG